MKWVSISIASRQEIYELWNADEKLLRVSLQPEMSSLRITADHEKRVFLVEREGILRSRTVLRNEYGVRMAQLNYESGNDNVGTIDFGDERLTYSRQNDFLSDFTIYKNGESIVTCELPAIESKTFSYENHDFLILALCWYVFSDVKKHTEAYA
jgi:hypothetical protein